MCSGWPRRSPSSTQMPTFRSCFSSAKGEPSALTEKTVWVIKTGNCCSLACAARSPGHVMVIDFSVRDVVYRHCLYFSSVLLVQPSSSSTGCVSAGCGRDAAALHCFPSPPFIQLSPSPLPSGLLLIPLPALGQLLPLIGTAPLQVPLLTRDHHPEPNRQRCEIWGIWPPV